MPLHYVPHGPNIIGSHTIYKVRVCDDSSLSLKALIVPHGNENDLQGDIRSDCAMCSPVGIPRVLMSTLALPGWTIHKVDVKSAFISTGQAWRDVYIIPPLESPDRWKVLWLLLTAAYGNVNANSKC